MGQETLEEAVARKLYPYNDGFKVMDIDISEELQLAFINGVKWKEQRSEQDFKELWDFFNDRCLNFLDDDEPQLGTFEEWFKQFKNK